MVDSFPKEKGGSVNSAFDNDPETFVYFDVGRKEKPLLEIEFPSLVLTKMVFDFGYRRAVDYNLVFYLEKKIVYQQNVVNNNEEIKEHYLPREGIKTDRIRMTFLKTYDPDGLQTISEVFFFSSQKPRFFERIIYFKRSFLNYFLYFLWLAIITFSTGILIGSFLLTKRIVNVSFLYSAGIALVSFISFLRQAVIKSDLLFLTIPLGVLITLIIRRKFFTKAIKLYRRTFLIQLFFVLFLISIVSFFDATPKNKRFDFYFDSSSSYIIPLGFYKQDYLLPYGVAKIFFYRLGKSGVSEELLRSCTVSDRTPLVSFYSLPFLYFFGDRFFVFQGIIIFLVSLLVVSNFSLLESSTLKKRVDRLLPLIFIGHYFLFMFHFIPIRLVTLFFLINFYQILLGGLENERITIFLLAFYSSLAFLTHPASLPYIFLSSFYLWFLKKKRSRLVFLFVPFLFFFLWLMWGKLSDNRISPYLYSPLKTGGPFTELTFDFVTHFKNRFYNFLGLFIDSPHPNIPGVGLGFYRFTLIGAFSISGFLFTILGIMKNIKIKKFEFIFFVLIPIFFIVFVSQGVYSRRGLVDNLFPVLFFLLYWGIIFIGCLGQRWRKILLGVFIFENIILFFRHDFFPLLGYFFTFKDKIEATLLMGRALFWYTIFAVSLLVRIKNGR